MSFTASDRELLLEEQLCFALYAASRAVTDVYRPMLSELGLTYPQYLVLLVLWERDERTIGEIVDALALDYGTVSPLLKRLQERSLVSRSRAPGDERTVTVGLTDEGAELRERVRHIPARIGSATGLDLEQRRELISTLRRVTVSARAAAHDTES